MKLNIAIDGPAGAGKSTVARMVAQNLGYIYLDTGAMYRAITVAVLRTQTDINDQQALANLVKTCDVEIKRAADGSNKVYLNGDDVTTEIRQQAVNNLVSVVSAQLCVRQVLVEKQKQIADKGGYVLDGRDIGTIVMPDAQLKIFLVASLAVRAQRRYLELKEKEDVSLEVLTETIAKRDSNDTNNAYGPMRAAADAITLDTDNLTIDQVATKITNLAKERIKGS